MKFTGLILICATSCLALILPAIGVVQFPKSLPPGIGTHAADLPGTVPVMTQNALGYDSNNVAWAPTYRQRDLLPHSIPPNSNSMQSSPFPSAALSHPSTTQTEFPNNAIPGPNHATPGMDVTPSGNKLAMGIWLLLGPVCLLGLALWTLSPNPSGSKPKISR